MDTYVEPVYRHLKKEHNRRAVGVDLLTVTPVDEAGNTCLIVVVVFYLRVPKKWSDPTILSLVLFAINDGVNSETRVRPLHATYGSEDSPYFRQPDSTDPSSITSAWVRVLDDDLRHVRAVLAKFQQELVKERVKDTPEEFQNKYQPGDFVLFQRDPAVPRPSKLASLIQDPMS